MKAREIRDTLRTLTDRPATAVLATSHSSNPPRNARTDMPSSFIPNFNRRLRNATSIASLLALAACASTPVPPTAELAAARSAIGSAESAGASQYAAAELGEARNKLAAADKAVEQQSMLGAQRLAQQSRAEADLATAMAGEAKAVAVNLEMRQGNQALVEELQRKSGVQQ